MEDFISCSVCKEFLLEGSAYGYVHQDEAGEVQLDYGHKTCLMKLVPKFNNKKIFVHPAAFNQNDPLYVGYVGEGKVGE